MEFEFGPDSPLIQIGKMKFLCCLLTIQHPCRMQTKADSRIARSTHQFFTAKFVVMEFISACSECLEFLCSHPPLPSTTRVLGVGVWTIAQCWVSRMICLRAAADRGRAMATWDRASSEGRIAQKMKQLSLWKAHYSQVVRFYPCVRARHAESGHFNMPFLIQQLRVGQVFECWVRVCVRACVRACVYMYFVLTDR